MNIFVKSGYLIRATVLLCCLPLAGYAGEDIIMQTLGGALLVGVVLIAGMFVFIKISSTLMKTLAKEEKLEALVVPIVASDAQDIHPMANAHIDAGLRWGLGLRVALLALPLNFVWLFVAATIIPPVLEFVAPILDAWPSLGAPFFCVALSIPHIVMAVRLWHSKRPSMALGIGLSGILFVAVLSLIIIWAS